MLCLGGGASGIHVMYNTGQAGYKLQNGQNALTWGKSDQSALHQLELSKSYQNLPIESEAGQLPTTNSRACCVCVLHGKKAVDCSADGEAVEQEDTSIKQFEKKNLQVLKFKKYMKAKQVWIQNATHLKLNIAS